MRLSVICSVAHSLRDIGSTVEQRAHDPSPVLADWRAAGKFELFWHDGPSEANTCQEMYTHRERITASVLEKASGYERSAPVKPPSLESEDDSIAHCRHHHDCLS